MIVGRRIISAMIHDSCVCVVSVEIAADGARWRNERPDKGLGLKSNNGHEYDTGGTGKIFLLLFYRERFIIRSDVGVCPLSEP